VAGAVRCEECQAEATDEAWGWQAYRADDPEEDEEPHVVFYCPFCAEREFGWHRATEYEP
jgi:hypothetical protein